MTTLLLLIAIVIVCCVIFNKISSKIGVPMLLAFIVLGMIFGSDGLINIRFDDYAAAERICSIALIFIMFYGGFGTNLEQARNVIIRAVILSSLGTIGTAMLVGAFCHFALNIDILESMLIGSVISSTDAASVFSILRSKRLNLRFNTASLLEIESGSNDPFSYMLTIIFLTLMTGKLNGFDTFIMFVKQIAFGLLFGFGIAFVTLFILKHFEIISSSGFGAIFIVGVALFSYSAPTLLGGNGYLSVYITGIILGNNKITDKLELVHFFDAATTFMQMLLFFLLGLLSFPSQLPKVAAFGLGISLFLTFVARPAVIFLLTLPFGIKLNRDLLISWAGMRGAASIVFSIIAVTHPANIDNDLFHVIFFVVLFSILLQGSLIPVFSRLLNMIDDETDVMKTFNDYMENTPIQFIQFELRDNHAWIGQKLMDILLPPNSLVVLIVRQGEKIIPDGYTILQKGDVLILSGETTEHTNAIQLYQRRIDKDDEWIDKSIAELDTDNDFIIAIKRQEDFIIPRGPTYIRKGDILMITDKSSIN